MPRLDFYVDFDLFLKIRLDAGEVFLGRGSDCQVQLPRDRVSRRHAVIRCLGDEAFEIANLSPNGMRLNASILEDPAQLAPGDRIYIADYTIIYQPDDAPSERLESERTVLT